MTTWVDLKYTVLSEVSLRQGLSFWLSNPSDRSQRSSTGCPRFPSSFSSLVDFPSFLHSTVLVLICPRNKKRRILQRRPAWGSRAHGKRRHSPWDCQWGKTKGQISKPKTKAWRLWLPHEQTPERAKILWSKTLQHAQRISSSQVQDQTRICDWWSHPHPSGSVPSKLWGSGLPLLTHWTFMHQR